MDKPRSKRTEQGCGCIITTTTVGGESRKHVQLCPMHAAMKELRADLESVYTLTAQLKTTKPPDDS